jgi:hypothetical protein
VIVQALLREPGAIGVEVPRVLAAFLVVRYVDQCRHRHLGHRDRLRQRSHQAAEDFASVAVSGSKR